MDAPPAHITVERPTSSARDPRSPRFAAIRREARALLALAWPVIGAQLAQISMHTLDAVMAGRLGANELAGIAVGGSLWMPTFIFGMGVLMAVSPTVAHDYGAGRYLDVGHHLRQGLWLSQIVAVIVFFAMRHCLGVLTWLRVDPQIVPIAEGYLRAVSWGLPAICGFTVLRSFSESVSMPRPVLLISLLGLVVNGIGNWLFMYGKFGLPELGAVGCGVATAIGAWTMLGCMVAWVALQPHYRPFQPFSHWELPHARALWSLARLGAPIGLSLFMEGSLFAAVALLLGRFGADVVSGHQIAINVASITFMVPLGIALAVTVRVGQAMGRGDPRSARRCGTVGAVLAVAFMALAALVMSTCAWQIAAVYTSFAEVQSIAVRLLYMAAIFQVFDGLQVAAAGALRGLKDTTVPMGVTFLAYWGLGLPLGYVLGIVQNRGPQSMWLGLIAGLAAAAICLNLRFHLEMTRLLQPISETEHG